MSSDWDITGKVCLVTGANSGLGKETVLELLRRGAGRIIMACRNMETGREAVKYVREKAGIVDDEEADHRLSLRHIDLSSLNSVRKFAQDVIAHERQLNVLINNAAIWVEASKKLSVDGYELSFATNHLGHFLLTTLLLDLLKKSTPSRVVVVASKVYVASMPYGLPIDDLNYDKGWFQSWFAYSRSKLANILFASELDKRLNSESPSGVTVYSLHPGVIDTGLYRHRSKLYQWVNTAIAKVIFSTAEQGIMTTIHCATKPGIEEHSGKYFEECQVCNPWWIAKDPVKATRLWELSEAMVSKSADKDSADN